MYPFGVPAAHRREPISAWRANILGSRSLNTLCPARRCRDESDVAVGAGRVGYAVAGQGHGARFSGAASPTRRMPRPSESRSSTRPADPVLQPGIVHYTAWRQRPGTVAGLTQTGSRAARGAGSARSRLHPKWASPDRSPLARPSVQRQDDVCCSSPTTLIPIRGDRVPAWRRGSIWPHPDTRSLPGAERRFRTQHAIAVAPITAVGFFPLREHLIPLGQRGGLSPA
jgi:hypothetical protein